MFKVIVLSLSFILASCSHMGYRAIVATVQDSTYLGLLDHAENEIPSGISKVKVLNERSGRIEYIKQGGAQIINGSKAVMVVNSNSELMWLGFNTETCITSEELDDVGVDAKKIKRGRDLLCSP